MSKPDSNEPSSKAVKVTRSEEAKAALLNGTIGAVSLDTCIFTDAGYRLDAGNFKQLEQFKHNNLALVFSEITLGEVTSHLNNLSAEAKTKLTSALRSSGKFWKVTNERQQAVIKEVLGDADAEQNAKRQVSAFLKQSGAVAVPVKKTVDVDKLIGMYFSHIAPFEKSGEKKAEFPDALALLSLEAWAEENKTSILLVTKDKGCQRFCEESKLLFSIDDLGDALTLIQHRDKHRELLCEKLQKLIKTGAYSRLNSDISDEIRSEMWSLNWSIDADSSFFYEAELDDLELLQPEQVATPGSYELAPVDFRNDVLVARATLCIEIEATCSFSFFVHDSFDRDMVSMGGSEVTRNNEVEIDVLLTFSGVSGALPEFEAVELIPSRLRIDMGTVGPDFDDEFDADENG